MEEHEVEALQTTPAFIGATAADAFLRKALSVPENLDAVDRMHEESVRKLRETENQLSLLLQAQMEEKSRALTILRSSVAEIAAIKAQ